MEQGLKAFELLRSYVTVFPTKMEGVRTHSTSYTSFFTPTRRIRKPSIDSASMSAYSTYLMGLMTWQVLNSDKMADKIRDYANTEDEGLKVITFMRIYHTHAPACPGIRWTCPYL